MERSEGFILLVCLPLGLGHAGQHSYENKKQRNFPQLRLDLPAFQLDELCPVLAVVKFPCLSCCGVSSSQSTGSSLFYLPRAFVAWNWFVILIWWLLSMLESEVKESVWGSQFPTWWAGNLECFPVTLVVAFHVLPEQPQDMCCFAFPFCEMRAAAELDAVLWVSIP